MVVGPFEQEVEGTGIASVVVKVKGEHPATTVQYVFEAPIQMHI